MRVLSMYTRIQYIVQYVQTQCAYTYTCVVHMSFQVSLWMVEGGGLVQVPGLVLTKGADVVSLQGP